MFDEQTSAVGVPFDEQHQKIWGLRIQFLHLIFSIIYSYYKRYSSISAAIEEGSFSSESRKKRKEEWLSLKEAELLNLRRSDKIISKDGASTEVFINDPFNWEVVTTLKCKSAQAML